MVEAHNIGTQMKQKDIYDNFKLKNNHLVYYNVIMSSDYHNLIIFTMLPIQSIYTTVANEPMNSLVHSIIKLLNYLFIHLFIHSFIHPCTHKHNSKTILCCYYIYSEENVA